ncbi:MAG: nucleotidyltransferase domain-containing protein [Coxiellaceae bacterium]|nr:nucleotidyltransferase domain-containing protein [Coxiellaceae bacterium]
MINLEQDQLILLKKLLQQYVPQYEVRLFGSRITDNIKPFSDIDVVIMNDMPIATKDLSLFTFALSESDLRYRVDVVEWCDLDQSFQQRISSAYEVLQKTQG